MNHVVKVVSVNVGTPKTVMIDGKPLTTGIYKQPVDEPLTLTRLNFAGDGQADLVHHGGPDKAVCVYPSEHLSVWERLYHCSFAAGAFGENLTISGLTEEHVCIGDVFAVGTAVVQVSQPRQPCFKLAKRHGIKELPLKMQETGYTGFYFRVLQEGVVTQGDILRLVKRSKTPLSVQYINRIAYIEKSNVEAIQTIIEEPALSKDWREWFSNRLHQLKR